jgi:hypothetical protein
MFSLLELRRCHRLRHLRYIIFFSYIVGLICAVSLTSGKRDLGLSQKISPLAKQARW